MKIRTTLVLAILSLAALIGLTSCEVEDAADVNQDKIYTIYEAFYNSNNDKTWIVARFRFGGPTGTLLQLNDPAYVTFEGDTLPWNPLFFGHFKEVAGRVNAGTFSYSNVNGDVFNNDLPASEIIGFPSGFDTLTKSAANSIAWDGNPLGSAQRVGVFVGSWTWGQDALAVQTNENARDIVIGTQQMANVPLGNARCYMDRTTEIPVQEGPEEGGVIRGTFRATNADVQVVE